MLVVDFKVVLYGGCLLRQMLLPHCCTLSTRHEDVPIDFDTETRTDRIKHTRSTAVGIAAWHEFLSS